MRSTLILQAILAAGVLSSPLKPRQGEGVDTVVEVEVVTVVDYVSMGLDGLPTLISAPQPAAAIPTPLTTLGNNLPQASLNTSSCSSSSTTSMPYPSVISSVPVLATTASAYATNKGQLSLTLPAPTFGADPIPLSSISAIASSIASSISASAASAQAQATSAADYGS